MLSSDQKACYGIDAPTVIRNLFLTGCLVLLVGANLYWFLEPAYPVVSRLLGIGALLAALPLLIFSFLMIYSSRWGKFKVIQDLFSQLHLQNHDVILDVGCGRGALLIEAAKQLPNGKAYGIDLWQKVDQSGNTQEATLRNAHIEGIADRIEVLTGNMLAMPFPDQKFDVVVSCLAIHNLANQAERHKALEEIVRVLKPKGRLGLIDFQYMEEYRTILQQLELSIETFSTKDYRMFPPVHMLIAQKTI